VFTLPTPHFYDSSIGYGIAIDVTSTNGNWDLNWEADNVRQLVAYDGSSTAQLAGNRPFVKLFASPDPPAPVAPPVAPAPVAPAPVAPAPVAPVPEATPVAAPTATTPSAGPVAAPVASTPVSAPAQSGTTAPKASAPTKPSSAGSYSASFIASVFAVAMMALTL
jgi:hypothetical protein